MDIHNTIFNKNRIDINISNYPGSPDITIDNSVFTCRDLPFSPTSRPSVRVSSNTNGINAQLRTAITSTTDLDSPYLSQSGFGITSLKSPYANQPSHIAIQINSVGITSGTNMYGAVIGSTNAASFNVFDAHGIFISSNNSHLKCINNVFQNTQTYTVSVGSPATITAFGGSAVSHSTGTIFNTQLRLDANSPSIGNRFWNCHKGVDGTNIYNFQIENAIFRSTQSSTNAGIFSQGNTGLNLNTNRFNYYITDNEFTNIATGINIPLSPGSFTYSGTSFTIAQPGVYADRLRIFNNVFTGSVSGQTNSYMDQGVNISEPLSIPWYAIVNNTISPVVNAIAVNDNSFTEVHNGVGISGTTGFPLLVNNNTITLQFNAFFGPQYGINISNCNPGGVVSNYYGKCIVAANSVSFSSAPTVTAGALIWSGHNGYSLNSPSITCNRLAQATQGFVFDGPNPGTIWAGNIMSPLDRGLVLSNNGKIGVQGGTNSAIGNVWSGSWSSANHTYVDLTSNASNSKLYVKNNTASKPLNNTGPAFSQSYGQSGNVLTNTTVGEYNCVGIPNYKTFFVPETSTLIPSEMQYMEKMALYNFLQLNDSTKHSVLVYLVLPAV